MRVLSLFDGISCARVALGDRVTAYYASEVDARAMEVAKKNFPDTVHIGDVRSVKGADYPNIDLLVGGSPCQDLSIAKKDRKGLEGDRSGLFWEYVRVLREVKPKWFLLENVASMPKADKEVITKEMGVEPVMLDAALVSAQSRKRLFWTNIPNVTQPEDRGILLKHILQPDSEVDESMTVKGKSFCLTASYYKGGEGQWEYEHNKARKQRTMVKQVRMGHIDSEGQGNRVYSPEGKSVTLSANGGGRGAKTGLYYVGHLEGSVRKGTEGQEDLSRAHPQSDRVYGTDGKAPTLSASETSGRTHVWIPSPYEVHVPDGTSTEPVRVGHEQRRKLKNGKRADNDPEVEAKRRIETRNDDKCGTLTTVQKDNHVVDVPHARIRKLTPVECERLQGLPDGYTEGIPKTHRYKCLGNAFNVDVVRHLLSFLPEE